MADIESGGGGGKGHKDGKPAPKKKSTRVDFTPMVDLGFLLITFFMLTTTMNKATVMEILMPFDDSTQRPVDGPTINPNRALNIIIDKDDKIYYYVGLIGGKDPVTGAVSEKLEFIPTTYAKDGIRKVIMDMNVKLSPEMDSIPILKKMVQKEIITDSIYYIRAKAIKNRATAKGLYVFLKPTDESQFKNLIDMYDELTICNVPSYAVVKLEDLEQANLDLINK